MESSERVEKLKDIFKQCVDKMLKDDYHLIKNDSHEGSISFRIGHYLENKLKESSDFNGFVVDLEYNRNLDNIKSFEGKKVRPDLIVHKRGENGPSYNLMVIEIKKHTAPCYEKDRDCDRLKKFISEEYGFQYEIGGMLIINCVEKSKSIRWFKNGKEEKQKD